jgi:gas vesicle protein
MENKGAAKGFFIGILTGGFVGTVVALLYAPKSGKELRHDISKKQARLIKNANRSIKHAKDKASDIISDGKKKAEQIIDDAKNKVISVKEGAENILSSGKEILSSESDRVKDAFKSGVNAFKEERKHSDK